MIGLEDDMTYARRPVRPLPPDLIPEKSKPHKVKDKESWTSIALSLGLNPSDLIYFNFRTRNPMEVNWYLKNRVGCKTLTKNKKNFMFSSADKPGIIYLPILAGVQPIVAEEKVPSWLKNVWAGIGVAVSGDLFVVGAHDVSGKIYNLGCNADQVKYAWLSFSGYKFGAGLGGDAGAVFILAHGFEDAMEMNGVDSSWDFDISLGPRLLSSLKGIKTLGKIVDTIEKYKKLRYVTENAIKNLGVTRPGIYTIPIPAAGWGYHLWAGFKFGEIEVSASGCQCLSV
jgi:hypothetical protein